MSRVCAVSGKKAMSGNRRSHSLRATRRKWNVNLQKVHMVVDGKPVTVKISARALKTLKGTGRKAKRTAAACGLSQVPQTGVSGCIWQTPCRKNLPDPAILQ